MNDWAYMSTSMQVAESGQAGRAEQRRLLGEEVGVPARRAVDVGAGEQHHLLHPVARGDVEELLGAGHVEVVGLGGLVARVVLQAQVGDGLDSAPPEDVLDPGLADVELVVLDVLGTVPQRAPVEPDHPGVAVEDPGELPSPGSRRCR